MKRRSIVEFEKDLKKRIEREKKALHGLDESYMQLGETRRAAQIKIETLEQIAEDLENLNAGGTEVPFAMTAADVVS